MPAPSQPKLQAGRVYRTSDLAAWGKNPSRLARRLEREGMLQRLARGLFTRQRDGRFGLVPPRDEELLRSFLKGGPFVITGPERWNALGLGATALFAHRLVYNTKRSGELDLGGEKFLLRRVRFPEDPGPEWFVVDLIEHHDMAGVSLEVLLVRLGRALAAGRFHAERLREAALEYGTRRTQALVERACVAARTGA
ncbi:MAG: hypothetical protein HY721_15965 [Planctomycetes bacterium]|nr:hypothetical protein [Planctomycetota bacterium]